jgi:hypothetical protein
LVAARLGCPVEVPIGCLDQWGDWVRAIRAIDLSAEAVQRGESLRSAWGRDISRQKYWRFLGLIDGPQSVDKQNSSH